MDDARWWLYFVSRSGIPTCRLCHVMGVMFEMRMKVPYLEGENRVAHPSLGGRETAEVHSGDGSTI